MSSTQAKLTSRSENTTSVSGVTGTHSFDKAEVESFSEYISNELREDKDVKSKLPIHSEALFDKLKDGIIFW